VKDLYGICVNERGDSKMNNASVLQLLNEIEKHMDRFLQEFNHSEDIDKEIVKEETNKIKKQQRKENRLKVLEKEREENERKQAKRKEEKAGGAGGTGKFVKSGKTAMARSDKPFVQRKKEEVKKLTEEEMDMLKYLETVMPQ
jgi:hypothetical protein